MTRSGGSLILVSSRHSAWLRSPLPSKVQLLHVWQISSMKALLEEFLLLKYDVYQLKEIWAIREQINRSPIIKILVYYPFPLSPEAGYSASKGSVEKVDPWRQKLSVVLAVSVALGSLLAPLVGEKHWNRELNIDLRKNSY